MNQNQALDDQTTREQVRAGYAKIALAEAPEQKQSCCGPTCCNGGEAANPVRLAEAVGYGAEELDGLPEGANLGLSCGNPTALAALVPGETVLDLGSGGGFDAFIAGRRVGATGRAIGIDMTPEMISRARRNVPAYREGSKLDNVEFRLGEIEHLPVADASVDAVISNCVINLSPDKPAVWREIARVLKPGGRAAVSDMALKRPLPEAVKSMVEALVGCIAGASLVEETEAWMREAGLASIQLEIRDGRADAMCDWNDPLYRQIVEALPEGTKLGDFVTTLAASAVKP